VSRSLAVELSYLRGINVTQERYRDEKDPPTRAVEEVLGRS
jgi:hypothetical protein